jgi:competence protein ComEA
MRFYFARIEQLAIGFLILAVLGAVIMLAYTTGVRRQARLTTPSILQAASTTPTDAHPSTSLQVVVHVTGAVKSPGVYTLPADARIQDALQRAGGATTEGMPDALNLAARLEDGQRIYIPTRGEWQAGKSDTPALVTTEPSPAARISLVTKQAAPAPALAADGPGQTRGPKPLPAEPVNINTASLEALQSLPGIGETTAQRIIEYRREHGKFSDTAELMNIPRIGPKTLEKLAPHITL